MHLPKLERRPELDALRGLFLVWMTVTHLPTRFSDFVNQPLGFVTSAEGFVFVSALLLGRLYSRELAQDPRTVRTKLWKRSLKIYQYHLVMLGLAFTIGAEIAIHTHKAGLLNLLDFYLAHPFVAILGSVLLLYCPPLLDILPMYVTFLFITPIVLTAAVRVGWRWVLAASWLIWALAQFGLRDVVHNWIVHVTHLPIPLQETGAFNLFAWQLLWTVGMWLGAKSALDRVPLDKVPGWLAGLAAAVCIFFIGVRFGWFGPHLTPQSLGAKLDKWQIGPLRVLNLVAFTVFVYWARRFVLPVFNREPFLTLGMASLRVFCAHVVFVFAGLTMLYGDFNSDGLDQLHGIPAIALLACTFASLIWLASREVRHKRLQSERRRLHAIREREEAHLPPEMAKTGT
jgi:hypothetical protein